MKRVLLLMVMAALFLAGCGMSEAAQETTASLGTNKSGDVQISVEQMSCDVFPVVNTSQANVVCGLKIAEGAENTSDADIGPIFIASGVLSQPDKFDRPNPFKVMGTGTISDFTAPGDVAGFITFIDMSAKFESNILAEIDRRLAAYDLNPNDLSLKIPTEDGYFTGIDETFAGQLPDAFADLGNIEGVHPFKATTCQGFLIPGSKTAGIIMIGELEDGQQVLVSGLAGANGLPEVKNTTSFACDGTGEGEISIDEKASVAVFQSKELRLKIGDENFILRDSFIFGFGALAGVGDMT